MGVQYLRVGRQGDALPSEPVDELHCEGVSDNVLGAVVHVDEGQIPPHQHLLIDYVSRLSGGCLGLIIRLVFGRRRCCFIVVGGV